MPQTTPTNNISTKIKAELVRMLYAYGTVALVGVSGVAFLAFILMWN